MRSVPVLVRKAEAEAVSPVRPEQGTERQKPAVARLVRSAVRRAPRRTR